MDLEGRGRGAGAEGERGGEWEGRPRGAASASLSPRLVAGEVGSAGTRPVPTRVGGTGEGDAVRALGRRRPDRDGGEWGEVVSVGG